MIKKIESAILNDNDSTVVWGDGSPTRDFLYVKDAMSAIAGALNSDNVEAVSPINIATGVETSIKVELVEMMLTSCMNLKELYIMTRVETEWTTHQSPRCSKSTKSIWI